MAGMSEPPESPDGGPKARDVGNMDTVELITALEATRRHTGAWDDSQVRELIRRYGQSLNQLAAEHRNATPLV